METKFNAKIPLFTLSRDKQFTYAAGGGGSTKSGVKNGIFKIPENIEERKFYSTEDMSVSSLITIKNPEDEKKRIIIYNANEYLFVCDEEMNVQSKVEALEVEDAEENCVNITQLVYSKKNKSVFAGWSTGIIQKFELTKENKLELKETFENIREDKKENNITGMCLSKDQDKLFVTSHARQLTVYDCETGKIDKSVYPEDLNKKWDSSMFWGCTINADGNDVVLGLMKKSNPSYLVVVDTNEFKMKKVVYLSKSQISSTLSTDKKKTVASIGCNDGLVVVVSMINYTVVCVKKHHNFVVTETSIDYNSNVASVGLDYNYVVSPITKKSNTTLMIALILIILAIFFYLFKFVF